MSHVTRRWSSSQAIAWLGGGVVVLGMALGQAKWVLGGQEIESSDRSSRASRLGPDGNSQRSHDQSIEAQLDTILEVQQTILTRADELLEDLRIAKVRVSR